MNISNSKNQDHTLQSPIWSKPVVDCLLSNAGHCKIITLMSRTLIRSSSHALAILFFQALCGISPCLLRWLSFCLYGFLQQVCFTVATGLCRKCRRFAGRSPNLCASKTLALELCVEIQEQPQALNVWHEVFNSSSEFPQLPCFCFPPLQPSHPSQVIYAYLLEGRKER